MSLNVGKRLRDMSSNGKSQDPPFRNDSVRGQRIVDYLENVENDSWDKCEWYTLTSIKAGELN